MVSGDVHRRRVSEVPGRITERGLRFSNATLVPPPSVAIALAGQGRTRGTVALVETPVSTNQSVALVKDKSNELCESYLYHNLSYRYEELRTRSAGGGRAGLSKALIEAIPLPLPEIRDQHKIAQLLDMMDKAIAQTRALIAKQQRIKTGLMQDLLTRGIDEHGNLRNEATHAFKDSPLGRIPTEWEVKEVRNAGEVMLGRQLAPKYRVAENATPYLRVANVLSGRIDYSDVLWMSFSEAEFKRFVLHPGDILLNEGQDIDLVGRSAVFDGPRNTYCFQNTLLRFRATGDGIPSFFQYVFSAWLDSGRFSDVARQTTSIAHLGAERFGGMPIAVPEFEEQVRIVSALDSISSLVLAEQRHLDKLRRHKAALMHDLLTGKVPVTPLLAAEAGTS